METRATRRSSRDEIEAVLGVPVEELASIREVAEILGVPRRTASRYAERDDFPEPLDTLAVGRVWRRADIEKWGKEHLPLPTGRPRKR